VQANGTPIGGRNVEGISGVPTLRIVGPGRAGTSLADALEAAGWTVATPVRRGEDPGGAAEGVDLCVVSTPDAAIAAVARRIDPVPATVVAHLAGSLGVEVLAPHARRAALHPLASLPDRVTGARALLAGIWWAVEGDDLARRVVADLGGRSLPATADTRAAYHAAACIAANHTVVLAAQLERVAAMAGLPAEPFYDRAEVAVGTARGQGAGAALTGPAARGDWSTIDRHLDALGPGEHDLYLALVTAAASLAGRGTPVLRERRRSGPAPEDRAGAEVLACR
jgi:predicted short-subunit dehydrogenase-like oxidoreductase (DUF2520 family)